MPLGTTSFIEVSEILVGTGIFLSQPGDQVGISLGYSGILEYGKPRWLDLTGLRAVL